MVVRYFTQEEFLAFLKENGCEVVADEYWDNYDRIILKKGQYTFPFQVKKMYTFLHVVKLCRSLDIEPPAEHLKVYNQYEDMKNKR